MVSHPRSINQSLFVCSVSIVSHGSLTSLGFDQRMFLSRGRLASEGGLQGPGTKLLSS